MDLEERENVLMSDLKAVVFIFFCGVGVGWGIAGFIGTFQ